VGECAADCTNYRITHNTVEGERERKREREKERKRAMGNLI
jgi:hypothetical protein